MWRTIVGVCGDVRNFHLNAAPAPTVYVPFAQKPSTLVVLFARTTVADRQAPAAALKSDVRAIDPNQPIRGGRSMREVIRWSLGGFNATTLIVAVLASVALLLASLGIYGMIAFSVARRTHEIGVRMALGAAPRQVVRQVLGEGLRLAAFGGVPGLLIAAAAGRLLASKLHRVSAMDPLIFGSVVVLVVAVTALASYVPARRASRVDPVVATRTE